MILIIILRLFNVIFKSGIVPDDWCMGYITPVFESGDDKDPPGFKKDHSTIDHILTLKSLIDLSLYKKKIIYCCFID